MKYPDGPKSPALLELLKWIANPISYMEAAAQRYGDIFTLPFGYDFSPHVFVSNPQAIQQIFTNESKQFSPYSESLNNLAKLLLGEYSTITSSGNRHRRKRKLLMPPFHGERIQGYGAQICNITEQVMSQLPQNKPFCLHDVMRDISLEIIFQVVFGLREGKRSERLKQLITEWLATVSSPVAASQLFLPFLQKDFGAWSPWGYYLRLRKQLSELLYAEIDERRQQSGSSGTDILTLLLQARDEAGEPMTNQELHDELLELLVAGHESTAVAMTWALYWLHHLPSVGNKLLAELDSLSDSCDLMTMLRLPYLSAVCSEVMRIYPSIPINFPHQVKEPVNLMGYQLEPGTKVVTSIYLTHHREDLYPQPNQFKPERFLEREFSPYEYLPFGGGSRRCIGAALAQMEIKLVLATIFSRYQLQLSDNQPLQLQSRIIFFVIPAGGVKMVMRGQRLRQPQPIACV